MYGQIHCIVRSLVIEKFSDEAWEKVLAKSGLDSINDFMVFHRYDDTTTVQLIAAASECLGVPLTTVLEVFGEHFLSYCYNNGYDKMLMTLGKDFVTFMQNLDSLHALLSLTYKNFDAPSFRCSERQGDSGICILDYFSVRPGLHHIVTGLLRAVGRDLFKIKVSSEVLEEEQFMLPNGSTQYHVKFQVNLVEGERKDDWLLNQTGLQFTCDKYKAIDAYKFCELFPYHLVFDSNMVIKQVGTKVYEISQHMVKPGENMVDKFEVTHPHIPFDWESLLKFITAVYNLELKSGGFCLKGQMVLMEEINHIIFIASPRIESLDEMMARDVYLCDIPLFDVTRELVLLNQQRLAEMEVSKKLDETQAAVKQASSALGAEKERADQLLYQMLPKKVALQLKDGKKVAAEKFAGVTILFSDMPAFAGIAEAVEPNKIVDLLNDLYAVFDSLTDKNEVYKVETIGDVYFVVSGLPETCDDHFYRVANQGLDMVKGAKSVKSPIDKKSINVRVGIHSGPVVTGVVGLRMPRYCLFGDTVNTSSRMESHGYEGRVHCSPQAHELISKDPKYKFVERGLTFVKGKGDIHTYWLYSNGTTTIPKPSPQLPKSETKKCGCIG